MEATLTMTAEEMLGLQYDFLGHYLIDNVFTEIRNIKDGYSVWVQGKEEYVNEAKKLLGSDMYVGINPRSKHSGTSSDVPNLCSLVIDIDPVRDRGVGSTELQHDSAMQLGARLSYDFPGSMLVSSGSGAHVYFPIQPVKVINGPLLTNSLSKWMGSIRAKYATKELKIDSIFDLPRVIRIWGSHNTKSNRLCSPIGTPREVVRFAYQFAQTEEATKVDKPELALSDLEDRFQRLVRTNKRLKGITDGTITHDGDRSGSDFEFITILGGAGFNEGEIQQLVCHNPSGRHADPAKDIDKDIRRVLSKLSDRDSNGVGTGCDGTVGERQPLLTPRSLRRDSEEYLESLNSRKPGTSTGLSRFDELTSGLKPGKLYIFAARPGEGKTSLITEILTNVAERGKTCLFYPTEVGAEPIWDKIVSAKTKINLKEFQNGTFSEREKLAIKTIMPKLQELPLMIMEDFSVTPDKVEDGIKRFAPQVVAVDFLQAMSFKDQENSGEKYEAVRRLKGMAIKYNIPIILASQLSRNEGKADLRHLSGTKALEEFGDVISFIYQTDKLNYPIATDLMVMKSKYSATGLVKCKFYTSQCYLVVDESWKGEESCPVTSPT